MDKLIVFNAILILIITALLFVVKKFIKSARAERIIFIISPVVTILFHYSLFFYNLFLGTGIGYLASNPNLVLPIYPCNVVMWCALIYGLLANKQGKFGFFLSDYIFWFGLFSTLVGMFANVDFIVNPTLKDFSVTKSIVAHATLLFNLLLIPTCGYLKPNFFRNMRNIFFSVIGMFVIGLYCNLIFHAFVSYEAAYSVNSMFIIHSPFEGIPFLRYPFISVVALFMYFVVFTVCDVIKNDRENRWYKKLFSHFKKTN
jgi:ABC-type multidrug transport system fused ATPase/permease subunit